MNQSAAMKQYAQVGVKGSVDNASPHVLIQMLIDGAIERLNKAKFHMAQKNIAQKGESISKAITIVDGLKVSLDFDKGGEIAQNLSDLYIYMQSKLVSSNYHNDEAGLDEVISLLNEIRSAWTTIPQDVRNKHNPAMKAEKV